MTNKTPREQATEILTGMFRSARQEGALSRWADGTRDARNAVEEFESLGYVQKAEDQNLPETEKEKKKLNEKLARFIGCRVIKKKMGFEKNGNPIWLFCGCDKGIMENHTDCNYHYPNLLIDFTDSLDACFKWLVPKLWKQGYKIILTNYDDDVCQASILFGYNSHSEKDANPALALCLAIEKLISSESKGGKE